MNCPDCGDPLDHEGLCRVCREVARMDAEERKLELRRELRDNP